MYIYTTYMHTCIHAYMRTYKNTHIHTPIIHHKVQMSPERVVVKEVPFEVEVTREVPVPVERVIYKEVLVRISIHMFLKYLFFSKLKYLISQN